MKTFSQKPSDVSRRWVLFDAAELPLGRLATQIATHLTGKYKPTYTPHTDGGDYVVVINAAKAVVTGHKEAVKGMLPKNKLQAERLKRLRVFAGEEHAHTAQTPEKVEVK
jgi:large subunit ribosomal protein L13